MEKLRRDFRKKEEPQEEEFCGGQGEGRWEVGGKERTPGGREERE